MNARFRPHRSLRSEVGLLALALAAPCLLAVSFPLDALRPFSSAPAPESSLSCSFVMLTPEEEHKVLVTARAAWQLDRGSRRCENIDLFAAPLPLLPPRAVLGRTVRARADRCAAAAYFPDFLPATLAAPPPAMIAPQPDADAITPTFSKEELLKLK